MYSSSTNATHVSPAGGCARIGAFAQPWEIHYEAGALVVVGGLPGAGKTWLLDRLGLDVEVVSAESEIIRRFGPTPAWEWVSFSDAIGWALERTEEGLSEGRPMILESVALFEGPRRAALHIAAMQDRPAHLLYLQCPPEIARRGQRRRGRVLPGRIWRSYVRESGEPRSPEHGPQELAEREGWASVLVVDREAADELSDIVFAKIPAGSGRWSRIEA